MRPTPLRSAHGPLRESERPGGDLILATHGLRCDGVIGESKNGIWGRGAAGGLDTLVRVPTRLIARRIPEEISRGRGRYEGANSKDHVDDVPTRARELSRSRARHVRTSDRRLTQRDVDEWLARVLLDIAEARELAKEAANPRLKLAVEALEGAALNVLRELGGVHGMPDISDVVARVVAESRSDSSSLRLLGRDLRDF
jgi:hypothetical protein